MIAGNAERSGPVGALLALCLAAASAHAQPPAVHLHEGETLRAEHGASDRTRYVFEAPDAGPFLLRVEQLGLDLVVAVEGPSGLVQSVNSPLFRDGSEWLVIEAPGRYGVEVRSEEHTGARGGHAISVQRLNSTDVRELAAWKALAAGAAANFAGGETAWTRSAESYDEAARGWEALARTREQADAVFGAASVRYWQLYDWPGAAEGAARAATLYTALGELALAANATHLAGASHVEEAIEARQSATDLGVSTESAALFARALELLEQARAAHERLGNVYDLGLVLNNFGYTYFSMGAPERARAYYLEAATLLGSIAEWTVESYALQNIGVLDGEAGELVSASAAFQRILELLPPSKPGDRANVLDNLGAAQRLLGDTEAALQTFTASLALQQAADDAAGVGRALRRIGETYYTLGELDLAKQYLTQALPIAIETNDGRGQEGVLRNLGNVAYLERDYPAALDHHRRALEVAASVTDRANLQLLIAKDLLALDRGADAAAAAAAAAGVAADTGSAVLRAGALNAAGRAKLLMGDAVGAGADLEQAAALFAGLGMRAERAEALHGLSLAARGGGRFDEAVAHGDEALLELERLRERVADPELRAFFVAARREYYEAQIDLWMRGAPASDERRVRAALQVNERSRARMTADLLQEAAIDLRRSADPSLLTRERSLYAQLAELRNRRDAALERSAPAPELERVVGQLAEVENSLNLLEIELRRSNPRLADVAAPRALTPEEMQARLDDDTVLLQYALGADASYVWAVTRDAVAVTRLADRATIEAAARRALQSVQNYAAGTPTSSELAELAALVVEPVATRLAKQRVVLALDGALQYVPFGVLPMRGSEGVARALLESHEVVEIPSISAMAGLRRAASSQPSKTLAMFADPVFEATDPRLGGAPTTSLLAATNERAVRSAANERLGRLLSSGYEAESIAALVPQDRVVLSRGFAANRDAVLGTELSDFRYIHFATHGLVDARYPGLSALVLSRFDDRGNAQDGFLRLSDIYNLSLDADVVVLSACETALGREVRGEGLIGLTQGFMAAGARSLVASLWQVPDRATAELMTKFYGFMLNDGLRPAEALRAAQLWTAQQPRSRHPYFWGGFVLVGDW